VNYKFSPVSQSWLKLGSGDEDSRVDLNDQGRGILTQLDYRPAAGHPVSPQLRLEADEWSWGLERAQTDTDSLLTATSVPSRYAITRPTLTGPGTST